MRLSPFALYSAVATQSAMALLLACALFVLGRYYPRSFLRLWAGAWMAEAVRMSFGMVALYLRAGPAPAPAPWPSVATWVSQSGGLIHGVLLVAGAVAMYRARPVVDKGWKLAIPVLALLALLPAFAVPEDSSVSTRVFVRVGLLAVFNGIASLAAALLIRRARSGASLGVRWMILTLLAFSVHDLLVLFVVLSPGPVNPELVEAVPMVAALLMASLGIGTAIAMVEDEQERIRVSLRRDRSMPSAGRAHRARALPRPSRRCPTSSR